MYSNPRVVYQNYRTANQQEFVIQSLSYPVQLHWEAFVLILREELSERRLRKAHNGGGCSSHYATATHTIPHILSIKKIDKITRRYGCGPVVKFYLSWSSPCTRSTVNWDVTSGSGNHFRLLRTVKVVFRTPHTYACKQLMSILCNVNVHSTV